MSAMTNFRLEPWDERGPVTDFEYPKGNPIRCNDWRFDLTEVGSSG